MMAILDEACLNVGKVTDELVLEAMDRQLSSHAHYSSRQTKSLDKDLAHKTQFKIRHYAGDVVYNIAGFLDKNKDTLFQDFKRLLYSSKNPLISGMWPEGAQDINKTTKRPLTAGTLFKNSMIALVKSLMSKEPHYVRCVKPNEDKSAVVFNDQRVEHQVRYLGLLENVRVRRAGFAHRQPYDRFLKRYKMISEFTWPNFRGSDKDGTKVLIDEKGFSHDVKYGKTKIFIRSPNTLFALENMRAELIPGIVTLLQKQWRGAMCRQKYKKMKAALAIMIYYRRYKMKTYFVQMSQKFRHAKSSRDYGKSIRWPEPSVSTRHIVPSLRILFDRWRASMILSPFPRSEWPQLRLKMSAAIALRGKRGTWGADRVWKGDYLALPEENSNYIIYNSAIESLKQSDQFNLVLFSAFVRKTNKFNRCADRVLLVTDFAVYKLDSGAKFKAMRRGMSLQEMTGLSVSPGSDQLVVIHNNKGNDLVFTIISAEDRVGELVGALASRYFRLRGTDLPVNVSTRFQCMLGNKSRQLRVEVTNETELASFKKDSNNGIVYVLPPNLTVNGMTPGSQPIKV
uniref:Myosin-IA n=3 Tax=Cacopsylla melanoneura TaxID=428564 RepID=A0A8D8YBU6_9HEMI